MTGTNFDTAVEDAEYEAGWNADDLGTPHAEDLYQKDSDYLANLEERKALKEMFKKIIVNLINE